MTGTKKAKKNTKEAKKTFVGYEFTIQGKYYADTGTDKKRLKFYKKEKFILPEVVTYRQGNEWQKYYVPDPNDPKKKIERKRSVPRILKQNALKCFRYVIKHYHLEARLKEKYEDYVRFQTLQAVSRKKVELDIDDLQGYRLDIPIQEMRESQLLQFMAIKNINVNLENYYDLADKKTAVEMAIHEKKRSRPGVDRPLTPQEKDLLPPEEGVEYLDGGVEETAGGHEDEMDFFL